MRITVIQYLSQDLALCEWRTPATYQAESKLMPPHLPKDASEWQSDSGEKDEESGL
jgi:hypothetical protein